MRSSTLDLTFLVRCNERRVTIVLTRANASVDKMDGLGGRRAFHGISHRSAI